MADTIDQLTEFGKLYGAMFEDIQNFFRFERRTPDLADILKFDDAYYEKAADALKARIDHEMKYLRSPYLD